MKGNQSFGRRSVLVGAGASVMMAGRGAGAAETPQYGGRLRVAFGSFPAALDAALGRAGFDAYYWRQMYDQLVDTDTSLKPRPETSLAESWDTSDPRSLVLNLRKGVVFHDGTPFNAEAVKFNIERVLNPETKATARAAFTVIDAVEVTGEHVVKLKLAHPWGSAFSMLADRGGAMNSPASVRALGLDYGLRPSGTGPFKIAEVVTGSHVRFVRNDKYWGRDAAGNRLPYLDEIVITYVQDPSVQVAALRAGETDLIYLPYRDVAQFSTNPKFNVNPFDGGGIAYLLAFDLGKPPMDNVDLRLAVAHAINPEVINKAVYFNKAAVAKGGMWPTGAWAYDPTVPRPYYDAAKAKEHLRKGGKPDGFALDAIIWTSQEHIPAAEIVRAQLGVIGIKLNLHVYDVATATEKFYGGREAPLFLTSWSRYPEPDWIGSLNYKSDGYYNASKRKDARMDALIEEGASTLDLEKRKAIYRKVDEIVLGEAWLLPLLYGVNYATAPVAVQGLDTVYGWDAKMDLRRLWLRK